MAVAIAPETLRRAESIVGYTFGDEGLLAQALTHASIADERVQSNERLEFLGDAVLGFVVCEYLYSEFPSLLEGELTKIKSTVVSRQTCARIAEQLGLHELIAIGKGMQGRPELPQSLSAAVFESLTGALYLDGGYETARDFVLNNLEAVILTAAESGHQQNFKSVLQQHTQSSELPPPTYVQIDEQGPDHSKSFAVAVEIDGQRYEPCWARSKKRAEQKAALSALQELGLIIRDDRDRLVYREPRADASGAA